MKHHTAVLRICVLAAVACVLAPVPILAHGDLHEQIARLTAELARTPSTPHLYLRRGELHQAHADWDAALIDFDKAAELAPELAVVDFARGKLFLATGKLADARAALDRFLATQPEHVEGLVQRARTHQRNGDARAALADLNRAIAVAREPEPDHYLERAEIMASLGPEEIDAAVRGLDEGLQRLGAPITLALYAIELETSAKRYDAALQRLEVICDRATRKETWLARRGEILEKAGRPGEARDAYAGAIAAIDALPEPRRATKMMTELRARLVEKTADR